MIRLSILVACASVLQVAESLLPHPLPGVRLGLANIVTLITLVYVGPGSALSLAVLRTLVSSMVMGTFLTPTFVLSFSGGLMSALVMIALYSISARGGPFRFSLVGISVGGSVSHILTQVALVYLLFIRSSGVVWLWPWLALSGVALGVITGLISVQAVNRLEQMSDDRQEPSPAPVTIRPAGQYLPASSIIHRLPPEAKLSGVVLAGLAVVLLSGYVLYAAVFLVLLVVAAVAGIRPRSLAYNLKRVWLLALAALATPLIFTNWGRVLFVLGPLRITAQGLNQGVLFAARILLLFLATSLLALTTAPHAVAAGLGNCLRPLRRVGLRPDRLATALSLSWSYFPMFWESARALVGRAGPRKGFFDRLVHLPGDIVADLYFLADRTAACSGKVRSQKSEGRVQSGETS